MKLLATITNGLMDTATKLSIARCVKKVYNGNLIIQIKPPAKPASWNEHKYYRGVAIRIIANFMGHEEHEDEEVHQYVKYAVWAKYHPGVIPPSTADMSTSEFEDYMTKVRQWASTELGIYVPTPNEPVAELFY